MPKQRRLCSSRSFGVGREVAGLALGQRLRLDVDPWINNCLLTDPEILAQDPPSSFITVEAMGMDPKIESRLGGVGQAK